MDTKGKGKEKAENGEANGDTKGKEKEPPETAGLEKPILLRVGTRSDSQDDAMSPAQDGFSFSNNVFASGGWTTFS